MSNNAANRTPQKSAAEEYDPSEFQSQVRSESPDASKHFQRAHANENRPPKPVEVKRGLRSAAEKYVPSNFEEKIRKEGPQNGVDFKRAAHGQDQGDRPRVDSKQVKETAVDPRVVPPPELDIAGARIAHVNAMKRDDAASRAQTREERKRASKEEFLRRSAKQPQQQKDQSIERD